MSTCPHGKHGTSVVVYPFQLACFALAADNMLPVFNLASIAILGALFVPCLRFCRITCAFSYPKA